MRISSGVERASEKNKDEKFSPMSCGWSRSIRLAKLINRL